MWRNLWRYWCFVGVSLKTCQILKYRWTKWVFYWLKFCLRVGFIGYNDLFSSGLLDLWKKRVIEIFVFSFKHWTIDFLVRVSQIKSRWEWWSILHGGCSVLSWHSHVLARVFHCHRPVWHWNNRRSIHNHQMLPSLLLSSHYIK